MSDKIIQDIVRKAIREEVERQAEQDIAYTISKLKDRYAEAIASVTIKLFERVSYEYYGTNIVIKVDMADYETKGERVCVKK